MDEISNIRFIKPAGEVVFYIDKNGCHVPEGVSTDESAKIVIGHLDAHIKNIVNPLKQQRDELLAALLLAKDMMLANNLYLPFTLEVIDDAIGKAKGE